MIFCLVYHLRRDVCLGLCRNKAGEPTPKDFEQPKTPNNQSAKLLTFLYQDLGTVEKNKRNARQQAISTFVGYSQPIMEIKRNLRTLQDLLKALIFKNSGRVFVGCKDTGLCSASSRAVSIEGEHIKHQSGECTLLDTLNGAGIPVEIKLFKANILRDSNSANNTLGSSHFALTILSKRLQEILYLVKMWDWYGVPRLHGLCVTVPFEVGDYEIQNNEENYVTQKKSQTNSSITLW